MKHSANNQYGKRFLSVLLLIAMLFSIFPGAAWAEDAEDPGQSNVAESESSTQSADDATQPQPETQPAPQAETQPQPTQEPTTAPTESVQEPTTAPTESAQETTAAPTESTQEATTAPTESAQETTAAPTESIQEATTAPTETVPAAETEPAQPKTTEPTAPSEEPTPTVRYRVEFYFEHSDSKDSDNPDNYSRVDSAQLETARTALAGAEVTASDADRRIADEAWLFDAQRASDREESPFTGTYQDYKERSPFFGFDFDHAESTVAAADGSSVLKLYYRREIWSITLYKYSKDAAENEVYVTLSGKFGAAAEYPAPEELEELYASENGTFSGFFAPEDGSPASLLFNTESAERSHQVSYYPCFEAAELPTQSSEPAETENPGEAVETEETENPSEPVETVETVETEETENPGEPVETEETANPGEAPENGAPVESEETEESEAADQLEEALLVLGSASIMLLSEPTDESDPTGAGDTDETIYDLKIYYYTQVEDPNNEGEFLDEEVHTHFHVALPAGTEYSRTSPSVTGYALVDESQATITGTLIEDTEITVYYRKLEDLGDIDMDTVYDLKIYYYAENTEAEVYPHFHVILPSGTPYSWDTHDVTDYVLADENQRTISGVLTENTVIKVYYRHVDGTAPYTVNYFTMTMDMDSSEIVTELYDSYTDVAVINEEVRVKMITIPGYSWAVSDLLLTVTADGHAVKNLFFEQKATRVIALRTGTGYAKTIVALPGADITEEVKALYDNPPTKAGYKFKGWDQKLERVLDESGEKHVYMPDKDMVINAIWESVAETIFNVEFWFENPGSADSENPANYTRVASMNEQRRGSVNALSEPTIKDRLITDQLYLYRNALLNESVFTAAELADENFSANVASAKAEIISDYSADTQYISSCPFFGFNYAFAEPATITLDGTGVMRLYYSRESRTINLWEYPCTAGGVGNDYVVPNELWQSFTGKFNDPLPANFPSYDALANHYNGNGDNFLVYATNYGGDNRADQMVVVFYENNNTFTLLYDGKRLEGTYTWNKNSTWKNNDLTMAANDGTAITPVFDSDDKGKDCFTLKINGSLLKIEGISSVVKDFYKSTYLGIVEQNYAKTASTTQNVSKFRTSQDILTGELNFYPKYTSTAIVSFTRIIYAMPLASDGGFNANTNVASLTQVFNRTSGGMQNSTTTVGASAYVGYTLTGGQYRVKTRTDSSSSWNEPSNWSNITKETSAPTGPACYINSSEVLTLKRGTTDCYFEIQLAPVTTYLKFMDGDTAVCPNYYVPDTTYYNSSTGIYNVQYTEPLDFLYRKNSDGSLYTDEDGNYSWNYYLTDPNGEKIFDGWYLDGGLSEPVTPEFRCRQTTAGATWNVYAKWRPAKFTVTFDSMGGSYVAPQTVEIGQDATEPTPPTRTNFRFVGWHTEDGAPYLFETDVVANITLYAVWVPEHFAEYTVYHYLVVNGVQQELTQYRQVGYGNVGDTITVHALSTNTVTVGGVGYYIAADKDSTTAKSINLTENASENTASFYYNRQTDWPYTVFYLKRDGTPFLGDDGNPLNDSTGKSLQLFVDNYGNTLFDEDGNSRLDSEGQPFFNPQDNSLVNTIEGKMLTGKFVSETDMLFVTELAPSIAGYAMINCNGTYRNGVNIQGARGHGGIYAHLVPTSDNYLYIYYDELYTLKFDLQGGTDGDLYADRSLLYQETTVLPAAPQRTGFIFLNWNTEPDGSGTALSPGSSYKMPARDTITLYAQWASASASITQGRLLDRMGTGADSVTIAGNGAVTAQFQIQAQQNATFTTKALNLRLEASTPFPAGTVITLIVYPNEAGQSNASFYYYKVGAATSSIALTAFTGMGNTQSFATSDAPKTGFWCQACVAYPGVTGETALWLSNGSDLPAATRLTVNYGGNILSPAGALSVSPTNAPAGALDAAVTVSGLASLTANQSDSRHTHGTLADYGAVLAITLKDGTGKTVPFPENSTLSLNGTQQKAPRQVVGVITTAVTDGSYDVTASGLPTDKEITVCFDLCAADSANVPSQVSHPERLKLASASVTLPYTSAPEYAIRATLDSGDVSRVFAVPAESKTLTFAVAYRPIAAGSQVSVTAYTKEGGSYTPNGWGTTVTPGEGAATAAVTVPAGAPPGTYRITFTIGTAQYHYNLIITSD